MVQSVFKDMASIWTKQAQPAPEEPEIEQPEEAVEALEEVEDQAPEERSWGW